ncbi:MAG: aminoacyl-tRNA hydrolase [Deltaproteobacteria bacterium]|nr:aminoacyl-tRNA hydrolase [Deltaproteobacteria bacterium]
MIEQSRLVDALTEKDPNVNQLNVNDKRIFPIVGLGNPGLKYSRHRHNIGFMTLEALADELGATWGPVRHEAITCSVEYSKSKLILVKPQTFMNLSGKAVNRILSNTNIDYGSLIVIHDDLDINLGRVRIKVGGGDGGHKGIRSIADSLRFRDFIRVRLGVGRPPEGVAAETFVLNPFSLAEGPFVKRLIELGIEATKLIVTDGAERARNVINALKDLEMTGSETQ